MQQGQFEIDNEQAAVAKFNASRMLNTVMMFLAGVYAWQIHGVWVGIATFLFLWVARRWTANHLTWRYIERTAVTDEEPDISRLLKLTMASRWAWVILAFVVLAVSEMQSCSGDICRSVWG